MAKAKRDTVKFTGASKGDILIGAEPKNKGLKIKVLEDVPEGKGGPLEQSFFLLDAGENEYSRYLKPFENQRFNNAKELIELVRSKGAKKFTHVLNANMLKVEDTLPGHQSLPGKPEFHEKTVYVAENVEELKSEENLEGGAGFGTFDRNKEVEEKAIKEVSKCFRKKGWNVESVERLNLGYDLICRKDNEELHVEVKGISGNEPTFIITNNELKTAKTDPMFVICIVTKALSEKPEIHCMKSVGLLKKYDFIPIEYKAVPKS